MNIHVCGKVASLNKNRVDIGKSGHYSLSCSMNNHIKVTCGSLNSSFHNFKNNTGTILFKCLDEVSSIKQMKRHENSFFTRAKHLLCKGII